jgi:hypothetical protein
MSELIPTEWIKEKLISMVISHIIQLCKQMIFWFAYSEKKSHETMLPKKKIHCIMKRFSFLYSPFYVYCTHIHNQKGFSCSKRWKKYKILRYDHKIHRVDISQFHVTTASFIHPPLTVCET